MENLEPVPVRQGVKRKTLVFGLLLLGFGFAWLLRNFDLLPDSWAQAIFSWQMILIAVGLINVVNGSGRGFGLILILVGGFFLLSDLYDLPISFRKIFWPSLLILIGLFVMFGSRRFTTRKFSRGKAGDDFLDEVAVFGGSERMVHSRKFKGGSIVSVFGGSTIDLLDVEIVPEDEPVIEVVAVFGGSTLIVPRDWNVKIDVLNIFGGYSDKRFKSTVDFNKTITIKGIAVFGGGEIKSA